MLLSRKATKDCELEAIKYSTLPVLQFFIAKESTAAMLLFPWATYSTEIRNGFSRCPTLLWSSTHLVSPCREREKQRRAVRKATLQGPHPPEQQLGTELGIACLLPQPLLPSRCSMVRALTSHGFCNSKLLSTKIFTQLRCGKPS